MTLKCPELLEMDPSDLFSWRRQGSSSSWYLSQVKSEPRWAIELAPRGAGGSRAAPQGVEVSQQDPAKHGFSGELQPDTKLFRKWSVCA